MGVLTTGHAEGEAEEKKRTCRRLRHLHGTLGWVWMVIRPEGAGGSIGPPAGTVMEKECTRLQEPI